MMYPIPLPLEYQGVDLFADGTFTIEQACGFLHKSRSTLYRWMNEGLLPYCALPMEGRLIPRLVLKIFLEKGDFRRTRPVQSGYRRGGIAGARLTQTGEALT